jgi:hypothetical protein
MLDAPSSTGTPTNPSLPMVATSTISPSSITETSETTPLVTKYTWEIVWFCSCSICLNASSTGSNCAVNRSRSGEGRLSSRRFLPGAAWLSGEDIAAVLLRRAHTGAV